MTRLSTKQVIITGGTSGIGEATTKLFIAEGASVVFTGRNESVGLKLQQELGASCLFVKQDTSSAADWDQLIGKAETFFGPINVLINNAGSGIMKPLDKLTQDDFEAQFKANQLSVFLGMRAVVPSMKRAGSGSIANLSSIGGLVGMPDSIAYGGTKFAVRGMTKDAALELASSNIRINSVHPGFIATPMLLNGVPAKELDALAETVPLKRLGEPEEIAQLLLFLASDESSYCTGAEFIADGGYSMG